jgi:hypothetical protein
VSKEGVAVEKTSSPVKLYRAETISALLREREERYNGLMTHIYTALCM